MKSDQRPLLLVLGGNSDIGLATAREFAIQGYDILLAGRKSERLRPYIADFSIRYGATLNIAEFDVTQTDTHATFVTRLTRLPDIVLCAVGTMYDQSEAAAEFARVQNMIETNYSGPISILEHVARAFEARGSGRIIGLGSIAGIRGRASNYLYGSTKAAFGAYLEGLQHRLKKSGVRVDIIKPGFVRTRMTENMDLPASLLVSPEMLAKLIYNAAPDRREVIPGLKWFAIANIVRHLPNFLFLKTKL